MKIIIFLASTRDIYVVYFTTFSATFIHLLLILCSSLVGIHTQNIKNFSCCSNNSSNGLFLICLNLSFVYTYSKMFMCVTVSWTHICCSNIKHPEFPTYNKTSHIFLHFPWMTLNNIQKNQNIYFPIVVSSTVKWDHRFYDGDEAKWSLINTIITMTTIRRTIDKQMQR